MDEQNKIQGHIRDECISKNWKQLDEDKRIFEIISAFTALVMISNVVIAGTRLEVPKLTWLRNKKRCNGRKFSKRYDPNS